MLFFDSSFGFFLILLIVLISAGLIGGAQNRLKGGVDGKRLLRAVWRLSFFFSGRRLRIIYGGRPHSIHITSDVTFHCSGEASTSQNFKELKSRFQKILL
ncbi:DUF3397 family protein [Paenibacillus rhizoplanae]